MCCNCGYDVPIWHTSQTCPHKHDYPHHNDSIDQIHAKQYETIGWKVSKKAIHKTQLPLNPHTGQAWRLGASDDSVINVLKNTVLFDLSHLTPPNNTLPEFCQLNITKLITAHMMMTQRYQHQTYLIFQHKPTWAKTPLLHQADPPYTQMPTHQIWPQHLSQRDTLYGTQ
jgi:hypothetical protein